MGKESMLLRDLLASAITGVAINTQVATSTDLIRSVLTEGTIQVPWYATGTTYNISGYTVSSTVGVVYNFYVNTGATLKTLTFGATGNTLLSTYISGSTLTIPSGVTVTPVYTYTSGTTTQENNYLNVNYGSNHDDTQGFLRTALNGVQQWTEREYRTTGVVFPHMADNDIVSYNLQLSHAKWLNTPIDSFHLHVIPVAATTASGSTLFTWSWGWYNIGDTLGATLPNSGTTRITIPAGTQYQHLLMPIVNGITYSGTETYSSFFFIKITRTSSVTYNGELAIMGGDCHYDTKNFGSRQETTD